jgi:hypothetical protein
MASGEVQTRILSDFVTVYKNEQRVNEGYHKLWLDVEYQKVTYSIQVDWLTYSSVVDGKVVIGDMLLIRDPVDGKEYICDMTFRTDMSSILNGG